MADKSGSVEQFLSLLSAAEYHDWHSTSELFLKVETTWFTELLPTTQQTRILDLGCGTGIWTCRLCEIYPGTEVVGVDISSKMLEFAGDICGDKAKFIKANAINFIDVRRFSLIISVLSADYIGFEGTATAVAANLSTGGTAAIFFMDPQRYQLRDNRRIKTWWVAGHKFEVMIPDYTVSSAQAYFLGRGLTCDNHSLAFTLADGITRLAHCFVCRLQATR